MLDRSSERFSESITEPFVDRLLRFDPVLDLRYNAENDTARSEHLREVMYLGLVLFNIHNITNAFLMPDIVWLAVVFRLFIVRPAVLLVMQFFERMSSTLRECTVFLVVAGAFLIEIVLFWMTRAPLGGYAFSEFGLTLVYGNMLMALRFRHAILFTALSFALAVTVIWHRPILDDTLRFTFLVQIAMACIISLYANYKTERRRCLDYVVAHLALIRAEQADSAKREFQDQSRTDALTGLPNRRRLDECLKDWFADGQSVVVMMVDIDHFKLFNDALGHPAGDDCLRQIGALLAAASAQTPDVLCARFGGEEFTVALRSADQFGAARFASSLVRSIEALGIAHPGRHDAIDVVTASVGVGFKQTGFSTNPEDVVAAADHALYHAKRNGRNCYVLCDSAAFLGESPIERPLSDATRR